MTKKTISGHYGPEFALAHNNRDIISKNVDATRCWNNYYCVASGQMAEIDINEPRNVNAFWTRYREIAILYARNQTIEKIWMDQVFQEHMKYMRLYCRRYCMIPHNPVEAIITLLMLPLLIPCNIYLDYRHKEMQKELERMKQEQWIQSMSFRAYKLSAREAICSNDLKNGTSYLRCMDGCVQEMFFHATKYSVSNLGEMTPSKQSIRYATLEEIYDKVYEPSFRAFQERQRPCRRYEGTYLEQIREGQAKERKKKQQTKNAKSRTTSEAIEVVFGIGDKDNTGYLQAPEDADKSEALLKDYCDYLLSQPNICSITTRELEDPTWEPPFRYGLIIINLTMHADEATPGIHMTCIPYSRECKRGPEVQPAMGRALTGMGYPSTWKYVLDEMGEKIPKRDKENRIIRNKDGSIRYKQEPDQQGIVDWIEDQKRWIQQEMSRRYNWEREYKGSHPRGNLPTPDYQVARAEERRQILESQADEILGDFIYEISTQVNRLDSSVDMMWRNADDWELVLRYLNVCSDEEYLEHVQRAGRYLDELPQKEKEKIKRKLENLICEASKKADNVVVRGEKIEDRTDSEKCV